MKLFVKIGTLKLLVPQTYIQAVMDLLEHSEIVEQKDFWDVNKGLKVSDDSKKEFELVRDDILEDIPEPITKLNEEISAANARWHAAWQGKTAAESKVKELQEKLDKLSALAGGTNA